MGRHQERTALIQEICQQYHLPFLLVNQIGGNTELIFDGDSRVHAADGQFLQCAPSFREDLLLWDMAAPADPCQVQRDKIADTHDAIALGIHDYFHKTGGFAKVVLGLSGGIDSAVTCALAVAALGADRVVGVTMPSAYSSSGSVEDSKALADNLGIEFHQIPIKPAIAAFDQMLEEVFAGTEPGVAEENLQARSRGVTLMALSNKFNYLLLSSGNKSEVAVGYVTLYGDTNGGLAVLSDVFKTCVYQLARHINDRAGRVVIPENTITKPPSAELKPGQQDSDSLPPYDILDGILERYIAEQQDVDQIVTEVGCDRDLVLKILRQVDRNEYKRRQAPPGLRVTSKAFGIGRQMPIVMRWDRTAVQVPVRTS
jgi:NAD+ synthase (glutamine-hydrolysing)